MFWSPGLSMPRYVAGFERSAPGEPVGDDLEGDGVVEVGQALVGAPGPFGQPSDRFGYRECLACSPPAEYFVCHANVMRYSVGNARFWRRR